MFLSQCEKNLDKTINPLQNPLMKTKIIDTPITEQSNERKSSKPIEFVRFINTCINRTNAELEDPRLQPQNFENVRLVTRGFPESEYDVIAAWDDGRPENVFIYLGFWNDGTV